MAVNTGKPEPVDAGAASLAPAVSRAIRILELLETAPQNEFSLHDISDRLALPKSSVHNLCATLVYEQVLRRGQNGYKLGRKLVQLGSSYIASVDVIREFYDCCQAVPGQLNAMIQLSALDDGLNAVYLARQDCDSGLRLGLSAEIGRRVPANCTASGKALLAALPIHELERRLDDNKKLVALTKASTSSPARLRKELDKIRKLGFATDSEGVLPGVSCSARSIFTNHREDGLLAISITADKSSLNRARADLIQETLLDLSEAMQKRL